MPYEFICTVQWEYDKAFTIFLAVTCFVTPLIVTVVCYSSVLRVARRQARVKPPVKVGSFSASEHAHSAILDVTVVKLEEHNNSTKQGPSRIGKIFDQERDPDNRTHVAGNPENFERDKEGRELNSGSPSGANKMSHINPFVIVVTPGNKQSADPNINSAGRIGKSRVSPTAVASSAVNPSIDEIPQREELMVIQEKDDKTDSRKDFVAEIRSAPRKRGWMAKRRTEDGGPKR